MTRWRHWSGAGMSLALFMAVLSCGETRPKMDGRPEPGYSSAAHDVARSPVVDVPAIAGRSPEEVAAVLGRPSKEETTRNHGVLLPVKHYQGGKIEIVFVNNAADWITIYGTQEMKFSPTTMPLLGLPMSPPTFQAAAVMRWERIQGLREVSLFPGQGNGIHYAYVLVNSVP